MIGQVLIEMGYLTEIQLTTAIAKICQIPFLQIGKYNVNDEAISLVPSNVIRRLQILPLDILGNLLTIAMVNPFDYSAIREIEFHTGMKVKRIVCLQKDLEECFELFFPEEAALPMPDEDALPEIAAEEIEDDLESIFSEAEESIRTSIIEKKNLPMALSAPSSIIQTDREALVSMPSVKAIPLSKEESWEAFRMSPEYIFGHEMEAYFTSEVLKAQPIEDEVFNVISEVLH